MALYLLVFDVFWLTMFVTSKSIVYLNVMMQIKKFEITNILNLNKNIKQNEICQCNKGIVYYWYAK